MDVPVFELVVRDGTVVVPGRHEIADVGGRPEIVQVGGAMTGQEELDARGLLVIPGGVRSGMRCWSGLSSGRGVNAMVLVRSDPH